MSPRPLRALLLIALARVAFRRAAGSPPAPLPEPVARGPAEEEGVELLVTDMLARTGIPLDRWAAAATLESWGIRDVDALERYGVAGVFELADAVYARCRARLEADPPPRPVPEREPFAERAKEAASWVGRGSFFVVPMTIQLVGLFVLGFSLWLSLDFTTAEFTVIACATILSFVVADGFVASIGRLGSIYADQGKHVLAQAVVRRVLSLGGLTMLALAVLWLPLDALAGIFPFRKAALGGAYFLLLSWFWLGTAVLYVTKQRLAIVVAMTGGLGVIALLNDLAGTGLHAAHLVALGLVTGAILAWGGLVLARRAERTSHELRLARLPRGPIVLWSLAPYFVYGGLYYSFLFFDRLVAWSAPGKPPGYAIWFRTPYELGLDWALVSFIPAVVLLEYAINRFSAELVPVHERTSAFRLDELNRSFQKLYLRQAGLEIAAVAAGGFGFYYLGLWLRDAYPGAKTLHDFFRSPITFDVHHWAVFGYSLLAFGLLNGVFIGALARPWLVVRAFGLALAAGGVSSYAFSRAFDYWYAAAGIAVGAAVFALLTTVTAIRLLQRTDYHYFAAY